MRNINLGLLLLRVLAGGVMMTHGLAKFTGFSQYVLQFPDVVGGGPQLNLGLVVFAELVCAALVVVGLFTRLALVPLMITMGVAFFVIHGADPFQKKELALLFLGMFTVLFVTGPGEYSIQGMFRIQAGRFGWLLK